MRKLIKEGVSAKLEKFIDYVYNQSVKEKKSFNTILALKIDKMNIKEWEKEDLFDKWLEYGKQKYGLDRIDSFLGGDYTEDIRRKERGLPKLGTKLKNENMKKKVVKYDEAGLERLVQKILKEETSFADEYSRNLMAMERDYLKNNEQLGDIIKTYESHIRQLRSIMSNNERYGKSNVNESLPRRERERHATQFAKAAFEPYDRERQIMNAFGPYREDVPANVVSYLRKNPRMFLRRLTDVYGMDKMLDFIGYQGGEGDLNDIDPEV